MDTPGSTPIPTLPVDSASLPVSSPIPDTPQSPPAPPTLPSPPPPVVAPTAPPVTPPVPVPPIPAAAPSTPVATAPVVVAAPPATTVGPPTPVAAPTVPTAVSPPPAPAATTPTPPPPTVAVPPAITPPPVPATTPPKPVPPSPEPEVDERTKEERLAATSALTTGIPYYDTRNLEHAEDITDQVDLDILRQYRVAPLHRYSQQSIELGLTDQTDRSLLPNLQSRLTGVQLTFKTISHTGYNWILNHIYYEMFRDERDGDFEKFGQKLSQQVPKRAFQYIAQLAYWLDASDIHIEPQSELARIRFRLDGVLHPITIISLQSYKIFLSDLQTRAQIKWGSDTPQSGRISYNLMSHQATIVTISMRIETIPTFHGEEIVVRLFNSEARNLQLDNLGFTPTQTKLLNSVVAHPNGMVLTVGPTGSGKTSTLYALINRLNSPEVKIITLEDPVEYDLPGISQISVHTEDKESFAERLRAVMREDPNVVMIGEIRDMDTAKTALQAALTGHLVLSTFHATNAAAAISRMIDMIGTNPLFASAIRLIIAQRLARRICTHCNEEIVPSKEQLAFIAEAMESIPEARRPHLAKDFKLHHGKGCPICHGLGYRGRIAIVEMMPITPDIEQLMTSIDKTTTRDLQEAAVRNGMVTLLEDGLHKTLEGITTIEEIMNLVIAL
jgi:type II secretory ATPase GspE/PulE/Tfp pilus assembly ATPase PilB-like protein